MLRWLWAGNVLVGAILLALAASTIFQERTEQHGRAAVATKSLAQLLEQNIGALIAKADLSLQTVAREAARQARGGAGPGRLETLLAEQRSLVPELAGMGLADDAGLASFGGGQATAFNVADWDFFQRARADAQGGLLIEGPYRSPLSGRGIVLLARRLIQADGRFQGVVMAAVEAEHFRRLMSAMELGTHGSASLRYSDHRLIARFASDGADPAIGSDRVPALFAESVRTNPDGGAFMARGAIDGVERMVSYRRIGDYPLYIVAGLATEDYLQDWWGDTLRTAALTAAIILVMALSSWMVYRQWLRQLESDALFRLVVKTVKDYAVFVVDADGRVVTWNEGAQRLTGYRRDEILGSPLSLFFPASGDPDGELAAMLQAVRLAGSRDSQGWRSRKDGSRFMADELVTALADAAGIFRGFSVILRDVTEKRLAEQAAELVASEGRFRSTFEQAAVGMAHVAPDGRFLRVNEKLCAIVGYGRDELLGLKFQDITYPADLDADMAAARQLLAGAIPSYNLEKRYVRKDGTLVWINQTRSLVRKSSGEPDYFVGVAEDIQRRKEAEAALAVAQESYQRHLEQQVAARTADLVTLNKDLQGFTYAASHDMRAPLGRINSFSTLLERHYRDRLEGDGLLFLDIIRRNAIRITTLIDDLLDHAQVEQKVLNSQVVDVQAAVRAVLEERAGDLDDGEVAVAVALPPVQVEANCHGLAQVLRNLVENALKYSAQAKPPRIEIGGECMGGICRLWVRDNGVGFDMAYHDRIFELFRRLHTYEEFPGSGIGLALVKRAMERMGGRVWAESSPGQGATFFLELPCAREGMEEAEPA